MSLPCGHTYDTACLQLLAQSSCTDSFHPVVCIANLPEAKTCTAPLSLQVIRDLLHPEEESRLVEASLRAHLNAHPEEYHYCPTADCPTIYRPARAGTVIRCPSCVATICAHCHVEYHEGLSCEEYKDSLRPHAELFARWKQENGIRSCPKCKTDIQKNGGCNHIHCAGCKTHICWKCMQHFDEADRGDGVYGHMQRVHGGISG